MNDREKRDLLARNARLSFSHQPGVFLPKIRVLLLLSPGSDKALRLRRCPSKPQPPKIPGGETTYERECRRRDDEAHAFLSFMAQGRRGPFL